MIKESKTEINSKFVLVLEEDNNHLLLVKEHEIESSDTIIADIEEIVNNPQKTMWDLYTATYRFFERNTNYNFCYPYEYNDSFIESSECPKDLSFSNYVEVIKNKANEIKNSYNYKRMSEDKKEEYLEECLSEFEYPYKKQYAKKIERYIKNKRLYNAISDIKKNIRTKMFSSDEIGWTTFNYKISNDINVVVKTNFAYGSSSYFYLAIKYKDIVLIPYSDLVHYYYANMKDFISYTRSYACRRNSWQFALQFVADFVNHSKTDSQKFIRTYIMTELTEMMIGLRATIKNPEEVLTKIKDLQTEYISLRVIRPFGKTDSEIYEIMPSESIAVFKAEKITGSLLFIDSLNKIDDICPEVHSYIDEIHKMNISIKSEVKNVLNSIKSILEPLISEQEKNIKKAELIEDKIRYHETRIAYMKEKRLNDTHEEIIDQYKKRHPQYILLLEKQKDLSNRISELGFFIKRRTSLKKRMEICYDRLCDFKYLCHGE